MFPLPIHIYFEIAAFLTALVLWKKLEKRSLRWFVPFLFFIVAVEFTGRYLRKELHQPNVWLYNISIPVEFLFYAFIFYRSYTVPSFRILSLLFIALFSFYTIINLLFINDISVLNSIPIAIGSFSMVIFSLLCFYDIYLNNHSASVLKQSIFWIAAGVLLFNAGEFAFHLFFPYLEASGNDDAVAVFSNINHKLILILYSCLIIAFLCPRTVKSKV
jgi:hypothetical protein